MKEFYSGNKYLFILSDKHRMKNLISYLLCLSFILPAFAGKSTYSQPWVETVSTSVQGNELKVFERIIKTPQSTYSVGQIVMMKTKFEGEKSIQSVREFLKKEFMLNGLQEIKVEDAWRFEGYRADLRRQVVIYVSWEGSYIKVSSAHYRPMYGRKISLEVEIWHRTYHDVDVQKKAYSFIPKFVESLLASAYAQSSDCSKCAGNPMCLMLCSGASASDPTTTSTSGIPSSSSASNPFLMGMDMSALTSQLDETNGQLKNLNATVAVSNQNWANSNQNWETTNQNIKDVNASVTTQGNQLNTTINTQADNLTSTITEQGDQLTSTINTQVDSLTSTITTQGDQFNSTINSRADQINSTINTQADRIDAQATKLNGELNAFNANMEKSNAIAERGVSVAEKAVNPEHMAKVSAYSAVGAVLGATVANLAVSGIKNIVGFLAKWINGDLKRMKEDQIMKEFSQAMEVYTKSSDMASKLEAQIDQILASMAMYNNFKLDNSDVIQNIQRFVIETGFKIKDAYDDRCVEDIVKYERELVEFQSLAKILSTKVDPLQKVCRDLKDMFAKLALVEGELQNARPNLLKAEPTVIALHARLQNKAVKTFEKLQDGKGVKKTAQNKEKQHKILIKKNIQDTDRLLKDVERDCRDSFSSVKTVVHKKVVTQYCSSLQNPEFETSFNLKEKFPALSSEQVTTINNSFDQKYVRLGLTKVQAFNKQRHQLTEDFKAETARHHDLTSNLVGRLNLNPEIALDQLSADNRFFEKLMKEQAYLFSSGLKAKKLKVEEACAGISE